MQYNGTGTFNQLYNFTTEASSPPIEIAKLEAECQDMAGALTNCITRDGQGKPTANQDWNAKNLTNVNTLSATTINSSGTMTANLFIGAVGTSTLATQRAGYFTTLEATGATSLGVTSLGATTATGIDNTPIGATTASTGRFTTITTTGTITAPNFIGAIGAASQNTGAFTTLSSTGATTLGATTATSINSTPIGSTTRSTGAFTTLQSNSTTTLGATTATSINSTPIGASTPSTGAFTSFSASGPAVFSNFVSVNSTLNATALENTPIGGTTRAAGAFTTLSSNNTTTLGATTATSLNNTPVGNVTPSSVTSTNLVAQTTFTSSGEASFSKDPTFPVQVGNVNLLINGAMNVAQRGTTATVASAANGYCTDRWRVNTSGSSVTATQTQDTTFAFRNQLQIAGGTGNTQTILRQRIESTRAVAASGYPVAVTFWCYRSSGSSVTVSLYRPTSSENTFGSTTLIQSLSVNPATASLSKVVLYFNALPNTVWRGLELLFDLGAHGNGDTFYVTGVQLQVCTSTAFNPPYEFLPYSYEEMLCKRYFTTLSDAQNMGGYGVSTTQAAVRYALSVPMYAAPTPQVITSGTFIIENYSGTTFSGSTTSASWFVNASSVRGIISGFTGLTAGSGYVAPYSTSGTGLFGLQAEL